MQIKTISLAALALASLTSPALAQESAGQAPAQGEATAISEAAPLAPETEIASLGPGIAADPTRARAQEADQDSLLHGAFDLSGTAGVASNYHYRGVNLSGNKPAASTSLQLSHRSGVYLAGWGGTMEETAGSKYETDLTLGWSGDVGPVELDAGLTGYHFPGGRGLDYYELGVGASRAIGPVEVSVAANYAPPQGNLDGDNVYVGLGADWSLGQSPFSLTGWIGRETGAFVGLGRAKIDWAAGVGMDLGPFNIAVAWRDTNMSRLVDPDGATKGRVVVETSFSF